MPSPAAPRCHDVADTGRGRCVRPRHCGNRFGPDLQRRSRRSERTGERVLLRAHWRDAGRARQGPVSSLGPGDVFEEPPGGKAMQLFIKSATHGVKLVAFQVGDEGVPMMVKAE